MAYNIKIAVEFKPQEVAPQVVGICRCFEPNNSYIDSTPYQVGVECGGSHKKTDGTSAEPIGRSVYAADGERNSLGEPVRTMEEFVANMSMHPNVLSAVRHVIAKAAEQYKETNEFKAEDTISVEDYKEAFYFEDIAREVADYGITIEVAPAAAAPAAEVAE